MEPPLATVLIYARDPEQTAEFYQRFFGFELSTSTTQGLIMLESPSGGARIVIHQAARSMKLGHVGVKLVFLRHDDSSLLIGRRPLKKGHRAAVLRRNTKRLIPFVW